MGISQCMQTFEVHVAKNAQQLGSVYMLHRRGTCLPGCLPSLGSSLRASKGFLDIWTTGFTKFTKGKLAASLHVCLGVVSLGKSLGLEIRRLNVSTSLFLSLPRKLLKAQFSPAHYFQLSMHIPSVTSEILFYFFCVFFFFLYFCPATSTISCSSLEVLSYFSGSSVAPAAKSGWEKGRIPSEQNGRKEDCLRWHLISGILHVLPSAFDVGNQERVLPRLQDLVSLPSRPSVASLFLLPSLIVPRLSV